MDYKKKYKEALERMKSWAEGEHPECFSEAQKAAEFIFPELKEKESENEKIRKAIHIYLDWLDGRKDYAPKGIYSIKDMIAWLEKQGEQKLDDLKPKFKVGNWYQCTKDFFGKGVTFDKNTAYYCAKEGCLQNEYGCHIAIVKDLFDNFKLWTIQDAKDGDVLCCESGWTCIFKALNSDISFSSYCFIDATGWFCEKGSESHTLEKAFIKAYNGNIYPATKEQRDLLFSKMKEAGCEWDSEKKELKKIEVTSKESKDERLRKTIYGWIYTQPSEFFDNGFSKEEMLAWVEKQNKQSSSNIPSRETILAVWELGNDWKELTNGSISTEYGTQLKYIQNHWQESSYYDNIMEGGVRK